MVAFTSCCFINIFLFIDDFQGGLPEGSSAEEWNTRNPIIEVIVADENQEHEEAETLDISPNSQESNFDETFDGALENSEKNDFNDADSSSPSEGYRQLPVEYNGSSSRTENTVTGNKF